MKKIVIQLFLAILCITSAYAKAPQYDIVVALDGSGDFMTIQAAIESVRAFTPEPKTIYIKNGTYKEKIVIHSWLTDVTFVGENKDSTIITWADHANINNMGTFRTYTVLVQGNRLRFENLTIENNAPQLGQAVALHLEGDRLLFVNCRFLGNQDTIYTGRDNARQYFYNCYIEGTTDFIFGPSTVWFEQCQIHSKKNSYITAASTPQDIAYGYIFNKCKLTAEPEVTKVYLGRPWRAYAYTLFMNCNMHKHIRQEGWHNWGKVENEQTTRYLEYKNSGEGSKSDSRVKWGKQLTPKQAKTVTTKNAFGDWNPIKELRQLTKK